MKFILRIFCSAILVALFFMFIPKANAQKYCYPTYSSGCSQYIDSVKLVSNVNKFEASKSSCNNGIDTSGLKDTIKLYRGKSYSFRAKASTSGYYALFIDFNGDGDFKDPMEFVAVDNAGQNYFENTVYIPITQKVLTTRLRVVYSVGPNTDENSQCYSSMSGGETEDYTVQIAAFDDDLALMLVNDPVNYGCANSTQPVKVIVRNMGTKTQTSIPVEVKIGTSTISTTFSTSLKQDQQDTFTMSSTVSTSAGNTYSVKAYLKLSGDKDRLNDTFTHSIKVLATPSVGTVADQTRCGPGTFNLTANSTVTGTATYWYKNASTDSALYVGNTYTFGTTKDATVYYESRHLSNASLGSKYFGNRQNYGHMIDVVTKTALVIDSFDVALATTRTDTAYVYYRKGGYRGYETSQSDWIFAGKAGVTGKGAGNPSRLRVGGIKMEAGQTYGLYIYWPASNDFIYDVVPQTHSNSDVSVITGTTTSGFFSGITAGRNWHGQIYYRYDACKTPRKSVKLTVKPAPTGARITDSKPFTGYLSAGGFYDPDFACPGDTVSYELLPPTGLTNADLGTKWLIKSFTFKTLNGSTTTDTLMTYPSTTKNGKITFFPSKKWGDSTFVMSAVLEMVDGGCSATVSRYVSVGKKPTADFGFTKVCVGATTNFYDSSTVPSGINSYSWDFGNGVTATTKFPSQKYTAAGKYKVSLLITTAKGCSDVITKDVQVYAIPKPDFSATTVCQGEATKFSDSTANPTDIATYLWKFGESGATSNLKNPTYTYNKFGNFTVTLITKSIGGCVDSIKKVVTVYEKPKADFTPSKSCIGSPVTFTNKSTGTGNKYLWRTEFGDTSTKPNPVFHYPSATSFGITLYVVSGNGCTDSAYKVYSYILPPTANFTSTTVCAGKITAFTNTSADGATYVWDFGDNTTTSTSQNPTHYYSKAGTYKAKLKTFNADGCVDSTIKDVVVAGVPKAGFTATNACLGTETVFTNTTTINGAGNMSYFWNFGDGNTSTDKDPSHKFSTVGDRNVKLVVTTDAGCSDSALIKVTTVPGSVPTWSRTVNMNDKREVTFTPHDLTYSSYTWYFGDGDSSTSQSPTHKYALFGTYAVKIVVKDNNGCIGQRTDSMTISSSSVGFTENNNETSALKVFPNPFRNNTTITYTLNKRSNVQISVWDMHGREVVKLEEGMRNAGQHNLNFDAAKNNAGAGVYMVRMYIDGELYTSRIINVK